MARLANANGVSSALGVPEVRDEEELRLTLSHPFAQWRTFLHPSQRKIAYQASYSGPAQVTGGPGTGKTVTLPQRALLSERIEVRAPSGQLARADRSFDR